MAIIASPSGSERELLGLLVEKMRDYAIFLLDVDGRVVTWNEGARRLEGYEADEIVGRHYSIFFTPEDLAAGKPSEELRVAAERGAAEVSGWRVRKDSTRFWADVVITAVRDEEGALRGFAKVTRDLTDRRAAEQQSMRLAQTEEALRLRDEFLSVASHELKTPVTSLQLHLVSLQRAVQKQPDAPAHAIDLGGRIEKALRQIRRLTTLIESLLDVSRIATGKLGIHPEDADLAVIAREVTEDMQETAERAGSPIVVRIAPGARTRGWFDVLRMTQVIGNLLDNAIKYGRGKPVEIDVSSEDDRVRVAVTDHGIGFSEQDRERIFQRFERAVSARDFGGLGLGLYIARQVVQSHGGKMWARSEPGVSTTFLFEVTTDGARSSLSSSKPPP